MKKFFEVKKNELTELTNSFCNEVILEVEKILASSEDEKVIFTKLCEFNISEELSKSFFDGLTKILDESEEDLISDEILDVDEFNKELWCFCLRFCLHRLTDDLIVPNNVEAILYLFSKAGGILEKERV